MQSPVARIVPTLLASGLSGLVITTAAAQVGPTAGANANAATTADNCLTKPNAPSPPGSHWYYWVDRANSSRHCWYLRAHSASAEPAAPRARAATPPVLRPRSLPAPAQALNENLTRTATSEDMNLAPPAPPAPAPSVPAPVAATPPSAPLAAPPPSAPPSATPSVAAPLAWPTASADSAPEPQAQAAQATVDTTPAAEARRDPQRSDADSRASRRAAQPVVEQPPAFEETNHWPALLAAALAFLIVVAGSLAFRALVSLFQRPRRRVAEDLPASSWEAPGHTADATLVDEHEAPSIAAAMPYHPDAARGTSALRRLAEELDGERNRMPRGNRARRLPPRPAGGAVEGIEQNVRDLLHRLRAELKLHGEGTADTDAPPRARRAT